MNDEIKKIESTVDIILDKSAQEKKKKQKEREKQEKNRSQAKGGGFLHRTKEEGNKKSEGGEEKKEILITTKQINSLVLLWLAFIGILGVLVTLWNPLGSLWSQAVSAVFFAILEARYILLSIGKIRYKPPEAGIGIIWGRRAPRVKKGEGIVLVARYFPFYFDLFRVVVEKKNIDIDFLIRTKVKEEGTTANGSRPAAGGEITVRVSITYYVDWEGEDGGWNIIAFINSGEEEGVERILPDQMAEQLRVLGGKFDWEQYTFSNKEIKQALLEDILGIKITDLEAIEREIKVNGYAVVLDLGIKICRFNIGEIKPTGEVAKAAEMKAKEQAERDGQTIELTMFREQAKKMKEDLDVSGGEAIDAIQTELDKAKKTVSTFRGIDDVTKGIGIGVSKLLKSVTDDKEDKK